jgi:CubicO group peptidase (beta-lactamase class C family)
MAQNHISKHIQSAASKIGGTKQSHLAANIDSLISTSTQKPFNGAICISQNGKILYSHVVGFSDLKNKTRLKLNDQFVIGSVSKQFTAVVVLQELEKGHITLDVPIHKYLKELTQSWADTVTIYHLLTHTHGITSLDKPTTFKVGSRMDYDNGNNIGYSLLASIVEKTSKTSFAKLSADLFKKCGMNNTFHPDITAYRHLAKGHTKGADGNTTINNNSLQSAPAAGSFISTAGDLLRWNTYLHNGKLLKPETYSLMITKKKDVIRQHRVWGATAYGFGITVEDKENLIQLGQTGFAPGFVSMNYYFPKTKTSVVMLQNIVYDSGNSIKDFFYYHVKTLEMVRKQLIAE